MDLVVQKGSLQLPRDTTVRARRIGIGQVVPPQSLPPEEVERLLKAGVLAIRMEDVSHAPPTLPPTKGRWCRDPASLAGLSASELLTAVLEIDPEFSGGGELGEAALVQLLTADFDPLFSLPPAAESSDRIRPSEPSLRRARERAKG